MGSLRNARFYVLVYIPVIPALAGGGAVALGSVTAGMTTYGATNIAIALGFTAHLGCSGVASISECRNSLNAANEKFESALTEDDLLLANDLLAEGIKACSAGGVDLAFAGLGAANFINGARQGFRERKLTAAAKAEKEISLEVGKIKFDDYVSSKGSTALNLLKIPDALPGKTGFGKFRSGFEGMFEFLYDFEHVSKYLARISREVDLRIERSGKRVAKLEAKELEVSRQAMLIELMEVYEKREGFGEARNLENRIYTQFDWVNMLTEGRPFNDVTFKDAARSGDPHGLLTHRLQWLSVMMWMDTMRAKNPNHFNGLKASDYFRELGNIETLRELDWSDAIEVEGPKYEKDMAEGNFYGLWGELYDAFGERFNSPEFTRDTHKFFDLWYE